VSGTTSIGVLFNNGRNLPDTVAKMMIILDMSKKRGKKVRKSFIFLAK